MTTSQESFYKYSNIVYKQLNLNCFIFGIDKNLQILTITVGTAFKKSTKMLNNMLLRQISKHCNIIPSG